MSGRKRSRSTRGRTSARSEALRELIAEANKEYGEGTVVKAVDVHKHMNTIPLGHFVGDLALLGGIPEGQAAMFLGKEGGGKTTQAMRCVAQMQRKYPDKLTLWVDAEQTFNPVWAEAHGVDLDRVELVRTVAGEDAVDLMKSAKKDIPELGMIVLDSVNQTVPMKEYEESVGDTQVALLPRLMGRMCSHLSAAGSDRRTAGMDPVTEIFINQWRTTIGFTMGDPRVKPGGKQLAHYCATHLDFKARVKTAKDRQEIETPHIVEHTFVAMRTKGAASIKNGEYHVVVGPGHHLPIGSYDEAGTVLTYAKKVGLYSGAGKGQHFEGYDNRFAKMDEAKRWLERNPEEMINIKRMIIMNRRQAVGLNALPSDGYLLRHPD